MKHLKVFESYSDLSDNFKNFTYETRVSSRIKSICQKFDIKNWTINEDWSVDVDSNVNLFNKGLINLPLKFGNVSGEFNCSWNYLKNLDGSPNYVGGTFNCKNNNLTTLKGSPNYVGGGYYCYNNNLLTTLDGLPSYIGGILNLSQTPIYTIYQLFPDHKSFMDSLDYGYLRGRNIDKKRFQEAFDEIGIKLPKSIPGYKYI